MFIFSIFTFHIQNSGQLRRAGTPGFAHTDNGHTDCQTHTYSSEMMTRDSPALFKVAPAKRLQQVGQEPPPEAMARVGPRAARTACVIWDPGHGYRDPIHTQLAHRSLAHARYIAPPLGLSLASSLRPLVPRTRARVSLGQAVRPRPRRARSLPPPRRGGRWCPSGGLPLSWGVVPRGGLGLRARPLWLVRES